MLKVPVPDKEPRGEASAAAWFVTTHWSVVLAAKGGSAQASEALEQLCRIYWRPLYAFIRRHGSSPADAQDLTQEFFARLLSKDYLRHLHDRRGKFRSFLLTFVKHFLSDERDRASALKRGGGQTPLPLEDAAGEDLYVAEAGHQLSPDQVFERRWAQTVLDHALQRLAHEYAVAGKGALYDRLKEVQPGEHGPVSYAQLGEELGMTEAAIKSAVHRLRRRHRELLREEIAHTVTRPEDVDDEIRYLIGLLSK
ncbi:MAG: sigma-70 family RNA polymerase sigma factor [Verrucomicrobiota bacterium]